MLRKQGYSSAGHRLALPWLGRHLKRTLLGLKIDNLSPNWAAFAHHPAPSLAAQTGYLLSVLSIPPFPVCPLPLLD